MTTNDHGHEHASTGELLGAWALNALPPPERAAVPRHLADCAQCAAEAARLRETVRLLDGGDPGSGDPGSSDLSGGDTRDGVGVGVAAGAAPGESAGEAAAVAPDLLRSRTLTRALATRPPAPRVAPHAEPYAAAVAALAALLAEVTAEGAEGAEGAAWHTPVVHDWSVQDTVAHLVAADEHLAVRLGLPANEPSPGVPGPQDAGWRTAWATRTQRVIAHERARAPGETLGLWRAQAAALLAVPAARDAELAARAVTLVGVRLPVAEHFLVRAFETWIHAGDIGRALGLPVPPPPAAHLWRLVRLAVRILGLALGPQAAPVALTVVDAGRSTEWILGAEGEPVRAELALDPVDFCLLIGGRVDPGTVPRGASGDEEAVRAVLDRAARLAWL
ncbi:maleylpyruvate isomerase N-terminal domain-containing protein [Streptomyces sp. NPDC050085]|uniref:maleylpyruvate isomerase N-terminal domain-containing protein n=1 Tax=Streptomyces sp. NPDC050085 TaxID=3365600 RepID=UPI003799CDE2